MIKVATLLLLVGSIQGCFAPYVKEARQALKFKAFEVQYQVNKKLNIQLGESAQAQPQVQAKQDSIGSATQSSPSSRYTPAPEFLPETTF